MLRRELTHTATRVRALQGRDRGNLDAETLDWPISFGRTHAGHDHRQPHCRDRGCRVPEGDAGAALPAERRGAVSGGAAGAWRRLDQQGPHRQRLYGEGAWRKRHLRRLDRFPHAAGRAASGLDPGHQSRHPLAQGECARVQEPRPEWVGSWGTSSGGHQVLLAAMRALNSTYSALPGPAGVDARQAWVISGWGVLDPLLRYT